jgi:hypothetical protein
MAEIGQEREAASDRFAAAQLGDPDASDQL